MTVFTLKDDLLNFLLRGFIDLNKLLTYFMLILQCLRTI